MSFFSFMLLVQTRRMRDADDARKANDASRWLYARDTSTANRRYTLAHARIPFLRQRPSPDARLQQESISFSHSAYALAHTRRRQEHTQQYYLYISDAFFTLRMNSADFFSFLFLGTVLTHLTNCVLRVSSGLYYTNLKNFHHFLFFCLLGICYLFSSPLLCWNPANVSISIIDSIHPFFRVVLLLSHSL